MPSIARIFSFAAIAFAAFASAAPAPAPLLGAAAVARVKVGGRAPCNCAEPGVPSLPAIVADLNVDVKVYVDQITSLKKEEYTVEHVKPIVTGLCGKLADAAVKVSVLAKYDVNRVLATVDGTIDIRELGNIICALVISIFNAVGLLLTVVGGCKCELFNLLVQVGVAVSHLLECIFAVVGHLVADLVAVLCVGLTSVFWVIIKLNIVSLLAVLKISIAL